MPEPPLLPAGTLLDACAVLSLYATSQMAEIIGATPGPVAVSDMVLQEALYVRRIVNGVSEREPMDLAPLVASRALAVIGAADEGELQTFIDLSAGLDDGEAMTAALAIHRAYVLVTDDRKAERLLAGRVQLRATLGLVKVWADAEQVDDGTLRAALTSIYERGYQPPNRHPLKAWWDTLLSGGSSMR
ncbi:MAG: PIN domain-containing protein [Thermomicrobiales bacterium]